MSQTGVYGTASRRQADRNGAACTVDPSTRKAPGTQGSRAQVDAGPCRDPGGDGMDAGGGPEALAATQAATEATRDALAQAARAKRDELLVLASHDMKNAIGILDSALGMLEEMPEQAASMHGMMRRATHRLGVLVRALVDVDCLQRDVLPVTPAEIGWSAVATPVVEQAL